MRVVMVPSTHEKEMGAEERIEGPNVEVLASLMDFKPAGYLLPAFEDAVHGIITMNPLIFLSGTVVKGFGRGARVRNRIPRSSRLNAFLGVGYPDSKHWSKGPCRGPRYSCNWHLCRFGFHRNCHPSLAALLRMGKCGGE